MKKYPLDWPSACQMSSDEEKSSQPTSKKWTADIQKKKIGNDFWISIFLKCSCYIASKNVWNFSLAVVDFFFF